MMINENELREVIRNLLLEKKLDYSTYRGAYSAGLYDKLVSWARGERRRSNKDAGYDPNKFNIIEQYEAKRDEKITNRATPDTLALMGSFGKEIDRSTIDVTMFPKVYTTSLEVLESRWDEMNRLKPTGQLSEIMTELNTVIKPLDLGLSDVQAAGIENFYTSEYEGKKRKQEAAAREFIQDVKRSVVDEFPDFLKNAKVDVEFARDYVVPGTEDTKLITQEDYDKFEAFLQKVS